jgi:lysophospholipase L1-like esterase
MTRTKRTLLAVGIVILIGASVFAPLFFGAHGTTPTRGSLIRIACVGDSITEGSGYPEALQKMLGADYCVGNFGVSGSTVLLISDRPYINQTEYLRSKAFQPAIVIIMLGTNDARTNIHYSIGDFSTDYTKLISEYQAIASNPEIWLVTPPPILENELDLEDLHLDQEIIPQIQQVANKLDLPTIDVNTALTASTEYFFDGVHPNSVGAMCIATTISQAITFNSLQKQVRSKTDFFLHVPYKVLLADNT